MDLDLLGRQSRHEQRQGQIGAGIGGLEPGKHMCDLFTQYRLDSLHQRAHVRLPVQKCILIEHNAKDHVGVNLSQGKNGLGLEVRFDSSPTLFRCSSKALPF